MQCFVTVDHKSVAAHLIGTDCEGCKRCCVSSAVGGTDDDMVWNGSEEDGNVESVDEENECTD